MGLEPTFEVIHKSRFFEIELIVRGGSREYLLPYFLPTIQPENHSSTVKRIPSLVWFNQTKIPNKIKASG